MKVISSLLDPSLVEEEEEDGFERTGSRSALIGWSRRKDGEDF